MQQLFITAERLKSLKKDKEDIALVERICKCKVRFEDDCVVIEGEDGYCEFVAKSIIFAYGRGFEMKRAELLENQDYYFEYIDIGEIFSSKKRIMQVKARIIGENGKTKSYIESVSGAKISVYGDTISFIGTALQIEEAKTAINTLLDGGSHKLAYSKMEAAHRKNKDNRHNPAF